MVKKDKNNNLPSKNHPAFLLLLFFFSGFVGLCYQVIWTRELSVLFGKTNAAITVVVSVFMLGLGLGSLFWGKRNLTPGNLSKTFSFLQFGTAAGSFLLLLVFPFLSRIYQGMVHQINLSPTLGLVFIFILAAVLMFIPSFLMGGTFPVISQLYIRTEAKLGKGIGLLYGINTFGGILGAGLTGYYLIGWLGQRETQGVGIVLNILIGTWFLLKGGRQLPVEISGSPGAPKSTPLKGAAADHRPEGPSSIGAASPSLKRKEPGAGNRPPKKTKPKETPTPQNDRFPLQKFLILASFVTGFTGLAFEILWTRALATFTSNSIYSFSSILVIYLTGIGIGSFIYSKYLSSRAPTISFFGILQLLIFLVTGLTAVFLNDIPVAIGPFRGLLNYPILRMVFPGLFLSTLIMLLPTLLMGIAFPLVCRLYTDSLTHLRDRIGKIFFYNTLGSMVGPVAAGFVLIPLVGVVKGLLMVGLVNFLLAMAGWFFMEKNAPGKKFLLPAAITCGGIILLAFILGKPSHLLPPSIFRNPQERHELKYYNETVDGTVLVVEDKNTGVRSCYVNNNAVCGVTYDALKVVHYMGHLPLVFNPGAKNALVIGFGIGVTTSAVAQHPLEEIDCVEICPGVKEAAPWFENFNRQVWKNPKIRFIAGDGRSHLLLTPKTYDLISCDPVHPGLGSGSLYSREYFELCRQRLKPGGVISQYLPLHKLTLDDLKTLLNTFYTVFPHTMVWIAQTHGVLIGSNRELRLSFNDLVQTLQRIDDPFLKDPYLVASTLLLNQEGIKSWVGDHALVHTDNRPVLEYFSPGSTGAQHHFANISELLRHRQPAGQLIVGVPDPMLLDQYIKGQYFYIQGILYHNQGQREQAIRMFQQALAINPQNQEIRLFYRYLGQ